MKISDQNRVTLVGRLACDGDKDTFALAIGRTEKEKTTTDFHRIRTKHAEKFYKGDLVYLRGELRNRSYETKTGEKKYLTEVVVHPRDIYKLHQN